jgi:GDP-6-deoxy-D-talose 4-dehydrogenase
MASPSETVLLTGAAGFTGRRLAARLASEGNRVVGVTREPAGPGQVQADLADAASTAAAVAAIAPDVVVHLAGITTALHADIPEIYAVNVVGTANLLAALAAAPKAPRLVVVASSATVYAPPDSDAPIGEDHARVPAHHYGASKLAAEEVARVYGRSLPIIVTRPFNYTGPGQTGEFVVAKIVRHFKEEASEIRLGTLDLDRDFSDLDDIVEIYARLIARGSPGAVVNLCSGGTVHLADIVPVLSRITGRPMTVVTDPRFVRGGEPKVIRGSTERLDAMIGAFPRTPFRATLEKMMAG